VNLLIFLAILVMGIVIGAYIQRSIDDGKIEKAAHDGEVKGWNDHDRLCVAIKNGCAIKVGDQLIIFHTDHDAPNQEEERDEK